MSQQPEKRSAKPPRPPSAKRKQPIPVTDSPWLSDVERALESAPDAGAHAAIVADVWQQVAESGTPVIEEVPAGAAGEPADEQRIVTFVCRLGSEDVDVLLMTGWLFHSGDPTATRMRRVPGTDIGHLSLQVSNDWRACYSFAEVTAGQDLSDPFEQRRLRMGGVADENARRFIPAVDGVGVRSVVELPNAPTHPWLMPRAGAAADLSQGTVHDVDGRERRLWLHAPAGPAQQILVVLDGQKWAEALSVVPTVANLMADGTLPPTATVFVESLDVAGRWIEYGCSDAFLEFLDGTVLPWVRERCDATAVDAGDVTVCGQSLGGLTALYAVLSRPDAFGGAIAQSPSLWWGPDAEPTEWLTAQLSDGVLPAPGALDSRIVLQYGAHEAAIADSVERFLPVADAAGLDVSAQRFTGGHDDAWWYPAIGQALLPSPSPTPHPSPSISLPRPTP